MVARAAAVATKLFRAFQVDVRRRPVCGQHDSMLGARVPVDIRPDSDGNVQPGRGGMSVTPDDPARLPPHYRPERLGGRGHLPVFAIGTGHLGEQLGFRRDDKKPLKHGFLEPARTMPLDGYQAALSSTEPRWQELP